MRSDLAEAAVYFGEVIIMGGMGQTPVLHTGTRRLRRAEADTWGQLEIR